MSSSKGFQKFNTAYQWWNIVGNKMNADVVENKESTTFVLTLSTLTSKFSEENAINHFLGVFQVFSVCSHINIFF